MEGLHKAVEAGTGKNTADFCRFCSMVFLVIPKKCLAVWVLCIFTCTVGAIKNATNCLNGKVEKQPFFLISVKNPTFAAEIQGMYQKFRQCLLNKRIFLFYCFMPNFLCQVTLRKVGVRSTMFFKKA